MRAFIVGNGPSLKPWMLDMLKDEVSFAMNRINLIFDKTDWRPTHYVRAETPSVNWKRADLRKDMRPIAELKGCRCYLRDTYKYIWYNLRGVLDRVNPSTVEYFPRCEHRDTHFEDPSAPLTWHFPTLCTFGTSLHTAIQLAVMEDYGPLYLLGCDMNYKDGEPNHFDKDYEKGFVRHEQKAYLANGDARECHLIAERSSPVDIFDCTPGKDEYIHEFVDIEEAVNG